MQFLGNHKKGFLLGLSIFCLLAAIITAGFQYDVDFIKKPLGYVITPVQGFFTGVGHKIGDVTDFFASISQLEEENDELKAQLEALSAENDRLRMVDAENAKLTELLNIDRKYADYPKLGAEIISKDPGNWYSTFLIDKGMADGVSKNMVVLGNGGLAGRVTYAGYNYARVAALIDDASSVSAMCARTGDTGFVRGDTTLMENGLCKMEFIDAKSQIAPGDEITTSHLSSIYPPGIVIGVVTEVKPDPIGTKYALIQPAVDFGYMETVLVINELFETELLDEAPGSEAGESQ